MIAGICVAVGVALTFCVWCCIKVGAESEKTLKGDTKDERKTDK